MGGHIGGQAGEVQGGNAVCGQSRVPGSGSLDLTQGPQWVLSKVVTVGGRWTKRRQRGH